MLLLLPLSSLFYFIFIFIFSLLSLRDVGIGGDRQCGAKVLASGYFFWGGKGGNVLEQDGSGESEGENSAKRQVPDRCLWLLAKREQTTERTEGATE